MAFKITKDFKLRKNIYNIDILKEILNYALLHISYTNYRHYKPLLRRLTHGDIKFYHESLSDLVESFDKEHNEKLRQIMAFKDLLLYMWCMKTSNKIDDDHINDLVKDDINIINNTFKLSNIEKDANELAEFCYDICDEEVVI